MYYCYLFEAKSIQAYLFQSNKLRDVISASERLERLVDSSAESVLGIVLNTAKLSSDLFDVAPDSPQSIYFLRCKGGAFYAYCRSESPLLALRSGWTLTLSQLFPSLIYTDALSQAENLPQAMTLGLKKLNAARNSPHPCLPLATSLVLRTARTGKGAVPLSRLATQGSVQSERELDIDTELHRQAYQLFGMRDSAALQDSFTPEELKGVVRYPINFETQFPFAGAVDALTRDQRDAIKDMALIHIDGNGLGILLRQLKQVLQAQPVEEYQHAFRAFSAALSAATQKAAQESTRMVYQHVSSEGAYSTVVLPMRPIVLGGDDVTLFCRADLAIDYAETFCIAFQRESQKILAPLYQRYLANSDIKPYLTASGGVLFHKAGHPYPHCHQLVEGLCEQAKKLTKSVYGTQSNKVGPAALAFYRVSNATQSDIGALIEQAQTFALSAGEQICLTQCSYFVSMTDDEQVALESELGKPLLVNRSLGKLRDLVQVSNNKVGKAPMSMSKWRQLATLLSQRDFVEAKRLFNRSRALCLESQKVTEFDRCVSALSGEATSDAAWCWKASNQWQTFINDVLLVEHFQPVSIPQVAQEEVE
ncbi:hypothetical protein WM008_18035 [Vibrio vulnificus]|uniref:Cas10/Cmr2 second palm domain-containing protein n=1 Tax=Vibrio vulnificus TaxID=672 RepID=UPI001A198B9C|nr:hypothetical protein [Vibrio vulnificus]ELR8770330.1 hypothetical protein [Vibrio vulnificus]HAS8525217.1 hypothetical protein [Vibrio vulnificus]